MLPLFTVPKLRLDGVVEIVSVAATPVPLNTTAVGEVGALLTSEILPVALPAACGANCALKVVDAPGFNESGRFTVLVVNPVPVTLNCVMVNTPVPVLLNCSVCVFGEPIVTLPKLTLAGVTVRAACTPVPLMGTTTLEPCAVVTVTFPVTVSAAFGANVRLRVAVCPAVKVIGVVMPLAVTSLALRVTWEMLTAELPALVIVTLFALELPALTFPKPKLVGVAVILTEAAVPAPLNATEFGEFGALLATSTLPVRLPAVVGANKTLNVALCPEAIVAGVFSPLALKPAPETVNCDTVRLAVPVFVIVKTCDLVWPSTTLPKLKVAGETLSPAAAPVPVKLIVSGDPCASLLTVIVPTALPAAAGANFTLNVAVCDGFKVAGVVTPVTLNPVPAATTLEICTAAFPVLVKVMFCEVLLPVATDPKLKLLGLAVSLPMAAVDPVPASAKFAVGVAGSFDTRAIFPVTAPLVVGAKLTVIGTDVPALIVFGVVIPETPNSDPVRLIMETIKSEAPLLPTVRVSGSVVPIDTVPKSRLVGDNVRCGCALVVTVPLRLSTKGVVPESP